MTDETTTVERPAAQEVAVRQPRKFSLESLDRDRADKVPVSGVAGGVSFATALEVMEMGKLMALAREAVPKHLRDNPGACISICFQAVEWRMSPFQVANKSYVVNDRLAFESQLIHAVVEARAPIQRRLDCAYDGEIAAGTRRCIVSGTFLDGAARTYTSPTIKDIRVKNSPLWKDDPDQQLWYYASRSWARKWCPDVLMGIYTRDELDENPTLGREDEPIAEAGSFRQRVAGQAAAGGEGFADGHAERELAGLGKPGAKIETVDQPKPAADAKVIDGKSSEATAAESKGKKGAAKKKDDPKTAAKEAAKPDETAKIKAPANAKEYVAHAKKWIGAVADEDDAEARWDSESELRDQLTVPIKDRLELQAMILDRFPKKE